MEKNNILFEKKETKYTNYIMVSKTTLKIVKEYSLTEMLCKDEIPNIENCVTSNQIEELFKQKNWIKYEKNGTTS